MYLGLDIGTSSVKAVLMDEDQTILASQTTDLAVSNPHPGWSEQAPDDWWTACQTVMDRLATDEPDAMRRVRGIGLSGHMHGATLLDKSDKPLRPCILWNDGRSAAECESLEAREPDLRQISGNIAMPGFTAPKIEWVRNHEPDIFAAIAKVLLPKDYIRLKLTGEHVSEMSDSAGTLWLDVAKRDWSDALLSATGLERSQMPALVEGSQSSGTVRRDLADRWGWQNPPVVAGGGGDNAASACGVGAVRPGAAFLSLGTSGVLFVSNDRFRPNTEGAVHAFCHAVPETWHQMGVILSAAGSLEWLAGFLQASPGDLVALLDGSRPEPGKVLFLPYLSGERTPHNDANIRGAFVNVSSTTKRTDFVRAVLEGVAFAFADCLDALKAAGTDLDRATLVGGGSRSRIWGQIIADTLNITLDVPMDGDFGAAFGAARLGLTAATGADPFEICTTPDIRESIIPDASRIGSYAGALGRYRALYPAIKDLKHA